MSVATLKQAVQPKKDLAAMKPAEKVAHLLESRKDSIAAMLPRHLNAERLLKVAQIAATTTPALLECEIPSLISAIGQCAQMGLEPNTVLGHAYLVPFNARKGDRWTKSVQVIVGYKGLIDLARRSGHIISIAAHEVREKDLFELEYGLEEKLRHVPSMQDRGDIIGFYAVAHLKDGGHAFDFLPVSEVNTIRDGTQSKGKYGPWKDHYVEMGKKTAVRRLAKMLPLSVEFAAAAAMDDITERGQQPVMDYIDGEMVVHPEEETINPETGEITTQGTEEPPPLSLETLTKRVKAAASLDALTEIMNLPDCESLTASEVKQLSAAYEARCKELEG